VPSSASSQPRSRCWCSIKQCGRRCICFPSPAWTCPIAPFGVPRILDLCFWGGLYGIVFGPVFPRLTAPAWLCGLILGLIAALVSLLVVPAIKGLPVGANFLLNLLRLFLIDGLWGIGVGLILPLLLRPGPRLA
jgi:hypothetical protein